jgi:hypothetical protein
VNAGNGAKAHGESDERVLDEILSGIFLRQPGEESAERGLGNGSSSVLSYGQRALRGPSSDTQFESGYTAGIVQAHPLKVVDAAG